MFLHDLHLKQMLQRQSQVDYVRFQPEEGRLGAYIHDIFPPFFTPKWRVLVFPLSSISPFHWVKHHCLACLRFCGKLSCLIIFSFPLFDFLLLPSFNWLFNFKLLHPLRVPQYFVVMLPRIFHPKIVFLTQQPPLPCPTSNHLFPSTKLPQPVSLCHFPLFFGVL